MTSVPSLLLSFCQVFFIPFRFFDLAFIIFSPFFIWFLSPFIFPFFFTLILFLFFCLCGFISSLPQFD
jgi:hypothetical protein